jgi:hypothetical protein
MTRTLASPDRSARRSIRLGVEQLEDRTTPAQGDATIAMGDVQLSTASVFAGAVYSIKWQGHEYVDFTDNGRLAQSVVNGVPWWAPDQADLNMGLTQGNLLRFNPTEGGAIEDDRDPAAGNALRPAFLPSSSRIVSFPNPQPSSLTSLTQMAFWTHAARPLEEVPGNPVVYNQADLSNEYVSKSVAIGAYGMGNVIQYNTTFYVNDSAYYLKQMWLTPLIIFTRANPNPSNPENTGPYDLPVNLMYDPDAQQFMAAGPAGFVGPAIKWTGSYTPGRDYAIAVVSDQTYGSYLTPGYAADNSLSPGPNAGWGALAVGYKSDNNTAPYSGPYGPYFAGEYRFRNFVVVGTLGMVQNSLRALQRQGIIRPPADQIRADFNADGIADILWHNRITGESRIDYVGLPGSQPGVSDRNLSFAWPYHVALPATGTEFDPHVGDFDGDGCADILWNNRITGAANGVWYSWRPGGPGTPQPYQFIRYNHVFNSDPTFIPYVAKFNNDAIADILWHNPVNGVNDGVWVLRAPAPGVSGAAAIIAQNYLVSAPPAFAPYPADFNGDRQGDIMWFNSGTGQVYINYLAPNGATSHQLVGGATIGFKPAVGEFNGDGIADILWHNTWVNAYTGPTNGVWFLAANNYAPGHPYYSTILIANNISFVLGPGQDVNNPYVGFRDNGRRYTPTIADFNADGVDDIFWVSPTGTDPAALDDRIWYMRRWYGAPPSNSIVFWQIFFAHNPWETPY